MNMSNYQFNKTLSFLAKQGFEHTMSISTSDRKGGLVFMLSEDGYRSLSNLGTEVLLYVNGENLLERHTMPISNGKEYVSYTCLLTGEHLKFIATQIASIPEFHTATK